MLMKSICRPDKHLLNTTLFILQMEQHQEMDQLLDNAPPMVVPIRNVFQMDIVMYADLYQEPMKDVTLLHHLRFVMLILPLLEVKIRLMGKQLDNAFHVRRMMEQHWEMDQLLVNALPVVVPV